MSDWSPPAVPRFWAAVIGVLYLALLGYALIITQQLFLFGILPGMFLVSVYLVWRFLVAVEAIADALQRMASHRDRD